MHSNNHTKFELDWIRLELLKKTVFNFIFLMPLRPLKIEGHRNWYDYERVKLNGGSHHANSERSHFELL